MRAYDLEKHESNFKKTLHDAYGKQWTSEPGEFPGLIRLKTKDASNYFYTKTTPKEKITQHLTHGILSADIGALSQPNNHVSVPYVVARDGTVYQLWDDQYWSYHLGGSSSAPNSIWSAKSIGIEISNIGPLVEDPKNPSILNDTYGKAYCYKTDTQFCEPCKYRGYSYYATLTDAQYNAVNSLLGFICTKHSIVFSKAPVETAFDFCNGIPQTTYYFHSNVRKDKVDCGPAFDLGKIVPGGQQASPIVAAPTPIVSKTYIVKSGDTMYAIASFLKVQLVDLEKANSQTNPNLIKPGDVLIIP